MKRGKERGNEGGTRESRTIIIIQLCVVHGILYSVLEALIGRCPADRQICLFSATFPVTVKGFKQKFLPNAYIINLMDELTLRGISQFYAFVEERQKVPDVIRYRPRIYIFVSLQHSLFTLLTTFHTQYHEPRTTA